MKIKTFKKVASMAMALSMAFCASGCQKWVENMIGNALNNAIGDTFKEGPKMTYGDFVYCYVTSADSNRRAKSASNIAIIGLTKEGQQKETIVIPETIEGKPVILIGMEGLGWTNGLVESGGSYEKIYLPVTLQDVRLKGDLSYRKIFFSRNTIDVENFIISNYLKLKDTAEPYNIFYVSYEIYNCLETEAAVQCIIANLTYIVNSEIYWIDDYEDGELIVPPQDPTKEGYVFDGWYTESECINKWDFETDVYTLDESLTTKKLYAKWIENEN